MRVLPYGDRAVLVEVADARQVAVLAALLGDDPPPGVEEIVPAARTVLIRFAAGTTSASRLAGLIGGLDVASSELRPTLERAVVIPVVYDGADLDDVASLTGLTVDTVIARHAAGTYVCGFCGFAPGFSYLVGGDPVLQVPRLDEPRTAVPAGSVAIAGEFSAVYPLSSPGGWRLLGRTAARMWDLDRASPALAPPGTTVRFEPVRAGG